MENNQKQTESVARMRILGDKLREASRAYYALDTEIMSNLEYDALYDELVALEDETGIVLSGSPTVTVGYEAVDELPKEAHPSPMLSLDKTKDRETLATFLGDHDGLLSWKLDGLTVVLTYNNGELIKAVTRGNGEIGEVITANARCFMNLPTKIPYQNELVLRGEAVITYPDFDIINKTLPSGESKYKNPRNLCSGSVRQLNNEITASRRVRFYAFSLVSAPGIDFDNKRSGQMKFLSDQGFECVYYKLVNSANVVDAVAEFEKAIETEIVPSDGLVMTLEDLEYSASLGTTAKFPRDSIAFKWADELAETTLREIEWSASRTGLINPVAIFDSVELEGTTVSRASVHNISIIEDLKLGLGDKITVYKANMIIPQIGENLTKSGTLEIPQICPVCGGKTVVKAIAMAKSLYCENPECPAKRIGSFTQFVSRNAMNIDGLSEATLEKFIDFGLIKEYSDLYHLDRHKEFITDMEGFGEKSYNNLISSVDLSRNTTLSRVIFALGIPNIGAANAKLICKYYGDDPEKIIEADVESLSMIDGVGEIMAQSIRNFFDSEKNRNEFNRLLSELTIEKTIIDESTQTLSGKVFVVTGSLHSFENRDALKAKIESLGGKVTGSVTGKTDALINNDITSNSGKNKKAKELGVEIISEDDFIARYL